jgi:hypothetical protein
MVQYEDAPNKGSELTAHSVGFLSVPAFVSCGPPLRPSVRFYNCSIDFIDPYQTLLALADLPEDTLIWVLTPTLQTHQSSEMSF